jgi:hypothetical protein
MSKFYNIKDQIKGKKLYENVNICNLRTKIE